MPEKFKDTYRIESNRLQAWDYSSPGKYFITICINGRDKILGKIQNGKIILYDAGKIVNNHIVEIPKYHHRIILDEWVIIPNHLHCIIVWGDYNFQNANIKTNKYFIQYTGK